MKIFSWMQSKVIVKQGPRTQVSVATNNRVPQESSKEEFSDWPHELLAIGTFGNNNVKEEIDTRNLRITEAFCQDYLEEITLEEVEELQKELDTKVDKQEVECDSLVERNSNRESYKAKDKSKTGRKLKRSSSAAVLSKGKDSHLDSTKNTIGKKSLSFLFKKTLLCSSGFSPTPSLRDPFPELVHEKSRLKKILKTILSKKIYPQSSSPKATTTKKYLENKQCFMTDSDSEDEMSEANNKSKWVKTDSEYIVLEI